MGRGSPPEDIHMNLPAFIRNPRNILLLAAMAAAALLATALIGQYGFGLHPCHLCLYQRYPYAAIILLGGIALFITSPRHLRALGWLIVLLFALDSGIAVYHAGVEWGWFPGPSGCTNTAPAGGQTLAQMLDEIKGAPLVPCDQPMLTVLGLSMAGWNALAAAACAIGTAWLLRRARSEA